MASEAEEVAALDRILTRLALTENEELGQLLARLLPALVAKLSTNQAGTRAKVLELLSHINKRVKASPAIPLPLGPLAAAAALPDAPPAPLPTLFTHKPSSAATLSAASEVPTTPAAAAAAGGQAGVAGSPLVRSFGLVYVDLALPRATPAEQLAAVPQLLWGVASRAAQPRAMALRLATAALAAGLGGGSSSSSSSATSSSSSSRGSAGGPSATAPLFTPSANPGPREAAATAALLPAAREDQDVLLQHALKVLLYQRPSGGAAGRVLTPLAAAQAAANGGAGAGEAAAAALPPPPGLSPADVAELTQTGVPDQEALLALKLGLLGLLGAAALTPAPSPSPSAGAAAGDAGDAMDTDEGAQQASANGAPPTTTTAAAAAAAGEPPAAGGNASSSASRRPAMLLSPEVVLPHLLVAACDPYETVARRGEDLLRKVCNPEAATPGVNLEDSSLVAALVRLLLGGDAPAPATAPGASAAAGSAGGAGSSSSGAAPVGAALAVRIMQLLVRSMAAASTFPANTVILSHCLYGPSASSVALASSATGANARLQQLGMEWSVWVFKHAPSWQLKALAPAALQRLLPALDGGDPMEVDGPAGGRGGGGSSLSSPLVRGAVYQALATLSRRVPEVFQADPTIAASFFAGLTREPPGARAAVQEALGVLAGAYQAAVQSKGGDAGGTGHQLEELLATSIKSDQPAVRLCAVQWAVRLFPPSHLPSRHICVIAAGDTKPEVRELGLTGLGLGRGASSPYAAAAGAGEKEGGAGAAGLPHVGAVVGFFRAQYPALAGHADVNRPLLLQARSFEALVAWLQRCWRAQPSGAAGAAAAGGEVAPEAHLQLLEHALVTVSPRELVTEAMEALVELGGCEDDDTRHLVEQRYGQRLPWLLPWLAHHHHPARIAAARLTGIAAAGLPDAATAVQLLQGTLLAPWDKDAAAQAGGTVSGSSGSGSSSTLEAREGSLLAAGYVGAQCAAAGPALPPTAFTAAAATLAGVVTGPGGKQGGSNMLAAAAGYALGCWGLTGRLPDLSSATATNGDPPTTTTSSNSNPEAASSSQVQDDPAVAGSLVTLLQPLLADKEVKVVSRAVMALGFAGYGEDRPAVQSAIAAALLQLARSNKSEEVMLTIGEALALLLGGPACGASVRDLLRTNASTLGQQLEDRSNSVSPRVDQGAAATAGAGDAMDVDGPSANGNSADQVDRMGLWSSVLPQLLEQMAVAPQPEIRCATCVAMVSLVRYCGSCAPLGPRLPALQASFTALLGDANELTQDMASRGISLVYKLGGSELQGALLRQLVGVLGGDKGAAPAGGAKVTGDTKIFEEGALGTTPGGGGGLTTYKELCSLATDIGQPDLVYKFMDLARHSAAVTSRRGAAAGVAGIARLVGEQGADGGGKGEGGALATLLGQERLAALLPKLYRSQYDPSPRVAEAMKGIWAAMVDDTRTALDRYFEPLLKELLRAAGARLWRERQAAAAALSDLLQGRRWSQLKGNMEEVWTMVLRLVDDVKASVREAGAGTLRSLRGLSLRLMDATQTPAADVAGCCSEVLPLLAGPAGLASSVPEVRGVALSTIATAVKSAGAAQVRPLLPGLVPVLLESLSGLEDERLNYVEQNAERYGLDASRLDAVRVAASRSSPAAEALEVAARACDAATAPALVTQLVTLVRRGVGLNTKAGTARFIRTLTARLGADLQPAAPPLLKALVAAVAAERSSGVRKSYAAAAAEVVMMVGEKRRDKFVADALACYPTTATATTTDSGEAPSSASESQRLAGALLLGALLKASPDKFAPYAPQVLPVAFAARLDTSSAEVAAAWGVVWSEGAPSEGAALRAYGGEVLGVLLGGLGASSWGHKAAAAKAICELVKAAGSTLPDEALTRLTKGLLAELAPPRLWEGKQALLEALGGVGAVAAAKGVKNPGLEALVTACLAAAGRKKKVYRNAGLAALHAILTALVKPSGSTFERVDQPLDVYALVAPLLLDSIQQHVVKPEASSSSKVAAEAVAAQQQSAAAGGGGGKEGGGDGGGGEDAPQPLPLAECLSTLALAWRASPPATAHTPSATATLTSQVYRLLTSAGQPWQGWLAGVAAAKEVVPQGAWSEGSWWPQGLTLLVAGVLNVLEHAKVMQLRLDCLATLTLLLSTSGGGARFAPATPVDPQTQFAAPTSSQGEGGAGVGPAAGTEANGSGGGACVDPHQLLGQLKELLQQLCSGGAEQAPPALKAAAAATLQQLSA